MVRGHEVAAYYGRQAQMLGELVNEHQQTLEELGVADAEVVKELLAAKRALASVYLPALTDEAFARVARLTGFQGFDRRDPRQAMAHERKILESSRTKIEADDRYARRDVLVGPSSTLQQELDFAKESLAPLQQECEKFELLPDFMELVSIGYDTPAFAEKWYQASYWKHWSAGDRICKTLGMADFGDDVLPAYQKYREPRDTLKGEVDRLEKEITAIHELVREHDQIVDRLAHLEEIYLQQAQDFLGDHLEHADPALLEQWATGNTSATASTVGADEWVQKQRQAEAAMASPPAPAEDPSFVRAVQIGLRRLAGVQAKRRFVGEIAQQGVPQLISELQQRRQKAQQKAAKFSRPKYQYQFFDDAMVQDDFEARAQAIAQQRYKLGQRVNTLVAARNYDAFDLHQDPELWWLYLVDSPPPRRYYPSLWGYYDRHPNVVVVRDDRDDYDRPEVSMGDVGNAAAAYAAGNLERESYLS
jgi:hypothetical protein